MYVALNILLCGLRKLCDDNNSDIYRNTAANGYNNNNSDIYRNTAANGCNINNNSY